MLEGNGRTPKPKFSKGTRVEVKSEEVGLVLGTLQPLWK